MAAALVCALLTCQVFQAGLDMLEHLGQISRQDKAPRCDHPLLSSHLPSRVSEQEETRCCWAGCWDKGGLRVVFRLSRGQHGVLPPWSVSVLHED